MKNIRRIFLALLLTGAGIPAAFAQTGNVEGVIIDKQTQSGIAFANVVLVRASDSTQVMGMASSDSGRYVFKRVPSGTYFIQAAVMGYHRNNSEVFNIDAAHRQVQVPTVEMTAATVQLDKVVIRAKRPLMEMEAGKITMNVAQGLMAQEENAFEMLKKFPGVTIDKDDNISLNGKGGVLVLVDDRNTHLSGTSLANYLRSLPAHSIDKIETMTNPSSKYDAEGTGGIINFKTTKIKNNGFSGNVKAGMRVSDRMGCNGGVDLNWRREKITVYGSLFSYYGGNNQYATEWQEFADGSRSAANEHTQEFKQPLGSNDYFGFFGKGGIDYYINKNNVLSLTYQGNGWGYSNSFNNYKNRFYAAGNPDVVASSYDVFSASSGKYPSHTTNLNYEHTFDTIHNRKLTLNAEWIHDLQNHDGILKNTFYKGDFIAKFDSTGHDLIKRFQGDIFSFKADYEHPFSQQTRLEAGIKGSYVNNYSRQEETPFDSQPKPNRYLYNEVIGAAYLMLNHTFKTKTSLQVGVRTEYTYLKGHNFDLDSTNDNAYIRPFPNINISQPIGNKNQLSLSYRYRLSRPNYALLNPFKTMQTAYVYNCGNPLLLPEYSHTVDLTYSFDYKFFATLSYMHTDGRTAHVTSFDNITRYNLPINAGKQDQLNLNLSTNLTFFKIWRLNVYLELGGGYLSVPYNGKTVSDWAYNSSLWMQNEVDIRKNITLSLYSWGSLPYKSVFSRDRGSFGSGLSIKANLLDNKLTLSGSLVAYSGSYENLSRYPAENGKENVSYEHYRQMPCEGRVSISWRFDNGKFSGRGPRRIESSEESSRRGGKGGGGE